MEEITNEVIYCATDGGSRANGKANAKASWAFCLATADIILGNIRQALSLEPTAQITLPENPKGIAGKLKLFSSNVIFFNGLVESAPGLPKPSNNRGELTAMLRCLEYILGNYEAKEIIIVSDSEYTIKSVDVWSRKWILDPAKERGKLNLDLIHVARETLDKARQKNKISFKHIHSHKRLPKENEIIEWYVNLLADDHCQVAFLS